MTATQKNYGGTHPRSRAYSLRDSSPHLPTINNLKDTLTLSLPVENDNITGFTRLFRPSFNSVICSNRKSSIDFNYPNFNFINDNSIFISNSSIRQSIKAEEKEFQLVFENSFKFAEANSNNDKMNYDHFDHDVSAILFLDENASSQRKSSTESSNLTNTKSDNVDMDIIDQFME
jgi:hypothetical protein